MLDEACDAKLFADRGVAAVLAGTLATFCDTSKLKRSGSLYPKWANIKLSNFHTFVAPILFKLEWERRKVRPPSAFSYLLFSNWRALLTPCQTVVVS